MLTIEFIDIVRILFPENPKVKENFYILVFPLEELFLTCPQSLYPPQSNFRQQDLDTK
jgi:hypothetical protein